MLGRLFRRIYTREMQENVVAVNAKVAQLNLGLNPAQWQALPGFHAITTFQFGTPPTFNPTEGFPAKLFLNIYTGEIKVFSGYIFQA